jgi:hypothetical protein
MTTKDAATERPWVIPAGNANGFIICSGDDPYKPGPILMVVSAPKGRSRVCTDADINANTALMVEAVNSHDSLLAKNADLIKALEEIKRIGTWTGTDGIEYTSAEGRIARAAIGKART